MDWVVKNALSRDTEREHLNKILAEIKAQIDGGAQPSRLPATSSTPSYSPGSGGSSGSGGGSTVPKSIKIALTGDVTGEASGTSAISIATTLTNPGIQDAPVDGSAYWRLDGNWASVPAIVRALSGFDADGFLSWDSDDRSFTAREIQGTLDQIVVTNGDGINANPVIALDQAILDVLPKPVPSLPNADVVDIEPGMAVARTGAGYVRADKALSDRWNVVGLYTGDTAVPVSEQLKPKVDGVVSLTALQWDAVLGTSGGLATGMVYFLGNDGVLTVTPPAVDGEYNVAVGLALTSTDMHIRDMRPVQL